MAEVNVKCTDPELQSAMEALKALYVRSAKKTSATQAVKTPVKKKKKRRLSKAVNILSKVPEPEPEEFEYSWPTCACGMDHPPVPYFQPPDKKKCTFYWQIADYYPYLTLHRTLTTEIKFKQADADNSGLIEYNELKELLQSIIGNVSDRMVDKTFKEIDTDKSGTLDFLEVLTIVNKLIQRQDNNLPDEMKGQYSKVCSIQ